MTKRIGVTIATVLAAGGIGLSGLTSPASSSEQQASKGDCRELCPTIYRPVKCKMSDGKNYTFGNQCEAERFACQNKLEIISCKPVHV